MREPSAILFPTTLLRRGMSRGNWAGPGATYLGVDNFVSAQRAGLAEAFAADFAHEGSGSGVDRHVAGEVIVSIKHLRKDVTGTCGFVRESSISPERPQQTLAQPTIPSPHQSPFIFCKGFPTRWSHLYCLASGNAIPILQNRKSRPLI